MRFEYLEPLTVEEAVSTLVKYEDRAKLMAGGTDLLVRMKNEEVSLVHTGLNRGILLC